MAYEKIDTWKPNKKSDAILRRALEHIESVSYQVSARWLFYRLLQDGLYAKKSDYSTFLQLTSRARHSGLWRPDILADETREMILYPSEGERPRPDLDALLDAAFEQATYEHEELRDRLENFRYELYYPIDPNWYYESLVVIMFEARAMAQQFRQYTNGLTLCPFGGMASIPFKFTIAKYLEAQSRHYDKPVTVLYFGDADGAGKRIFNTGREDISKWCDAHLDWTYCGLTEEQAQHYGVPENIDHPGYQWEALTDVQASEIITTAIKQFVDVEGAQQRAFRESEQICSTIDARVNEWINGNG